MYEELRASVQPTSFSPCLYVNSGHLEFVILFDGSVSFDDEDTSSLLYFVKTAWKDQTWLKEVKPPYMIWSGCCGPIFQLDNIELNPSLISLFQEQGLTFILYEPVCSYRENILNTFVDHKNYDQFEYTDANHQAMMAYELDSINNFAKKYNIPGRVPVLSCNYKIKEFFQHKYEHLDLQCRDIFVSTDSYTAHPYRNRWAEKYPHKKFMCLNRRYTGVRHMIMLYLASTKNFYSGNYSWNISTELGYLNSKLWFDFDNWRNIRRRYWNSIDEGHTILNRILPLNLDEDRPIVYFIGDPDRQDPAHHKNRCPRFKYVEAFVSIVTETRFAEPMPNFSEKITNTIKSFRPFVAVAPPKTLKYLQRLGFKTFGDFWDESYDDELNHEQRLLKIFDLIDHIDRMTWYDQIHTLDKMMPILQHNAERLTTLSYDFPNLQC